MNDRLFMNACKDYGKTLEKNIEKDKFKELNEALTAELDQRLDFLLGGQKISELIKNEEEPAPLERGNRTKCDGVRWEKEHPMTKCMYYYNRSETKGDDMCDGCSLKNTPWLNISEKYDVFNYQIPMPYKHVISSVGKIDLIIKDRDSGELYAVEVKPEGGNDSSLSHMMAEIMTYISILEYAAHKNGEEFSRLEGKPLKKAIAFFKESNDHENTKQFEMYKYYKDNHNQEFKKLLNSISVFTIEKTVLDKGEQGFKFVLRE